MVNAGYPEMALDPHTTRNNQWNSNNLERRVNKGLRENLSIKSYNFGWKGVQEITLSNPTSFSKQGSKMHYSFLIIWETYILVKKSR